MELEYAYKQVEKWKQLQRFWNVKQVDFNRMQRLDLEEKIEGWRLKDCDWNINTHRGHKYKNSTESTCCFCIEFTVPTYEILQVSVPFIYTPQYKFHISSYNNLSFTVIISS